MDLVALQIFKTVVEEGGINSGAKRLHRVPSNVTMRIKQLEASLGATLFVREKRRLALSPAGELFLGYAEQLLEISERARHAVQDDAPRGVLRIGALESIVASRLPPLLSAYHRKFPGVRVELTTGTNDVLVDGVLNRRLDAAFVVEADAAAGLESMATFKEELVLIAPLSHPAIGHPRDVATDTVLSFGAGCAYRRRLLRWFASAGRVPDRVLELGLVPRDGGVCSIGHRGSTDTEVGTRHVERRAEYFHSPAEKRQGPQGHHLPYLAQRGMPGGRDRFENTSRHT